MNNKQQLEARKDGLTNTITSVAKDNYVAEPAGGGVMYKDGQQERIRHGN